MDLLHRLSLQFCHIQVDLHFSVYNTKTLLSVFELGRKSRFLAVETATECYKFCAIKFYIIKIPVF